MREQMRVEKPEELKKRLGGNFKLVPPEELEQRRKKDHPHTPESPSITEAKEILQDRVFGPEEVKQALGTHIDNPPDIPYTRERLEKAKEQGMDLILYTDKLPDGKSITGQSLSAHLGMKKKDKSDLLYKKNTWYTDQPFFTDESIKTPEGKTTYWKLVKREVIPGSTGKNYLDQTITQSNYIRSLYEDPSQIPQNIQHALTEFEDLTKNDPDFREKVTNTDEKIWKPATKTLANLQITQLFRESFIELLYRLTITDRTKANTAIQLLESMYSWTKSLTSDGSLVSAGYFGRTGLDVRRGRPGRSLPNIGCSFSAVFL